MRSIVCLLYLLLGYRESDSKDIRNYRTNRSLQRGKLVREGRSVMSECYRHRRSIRLRGYDYRQMGAYYVTLCTDRKYPWFGEIVDGVMFASVAGSIAETLWNNLPSHFPFLELDAFVLMPNHLHGILVITDETPLSPPPNSPNGTVSGSLGAIVQNFKSVSTRRINRVTGNRGTIWQRNYYEHIIRTDRACGNIRKYIIENPQRWHEDPENPASPKKPNNPP